jgi:sialic acid synthase SpsE
VDFGVYAGFSDHTVGITASIAALARGAKVLEKHYTLDKAMSGPDHAGSMKPDELAEINAFRNDLRQCL